MRWSVTEVLLCQFNARRNLNKCFSLKFIHTIHSIMTATFLQNSRIWWFQFFSFIFFLVEMYQPCFYWGNWKFWWFYAVLFPRTT